MDVVAAPDAAVGGPLDVPVPADLASPLQPVTTSVQRSDDPGQSPLQTPVAVCPPRSGLSEPDESATQTDWDSQVAAEELSGEGQARQPNVPDWAIMETPPVAEVSPLRASPATAPPVEAVAPPAPAAQRPGLTYQALINAVRPSWFEGGLAHSRVADDVLARYTLLIDRAGILSALDWMMFQRRDVASYLDWCLGEHQASGESPADTLRSLREVLSRIYHAPVE